MTDKDFDEVFAADSADEKKPENPAISLRAQRQEREDEARNQFLSAFAQEPGADAHQDEPAQAAVAAAAEAAHAAAASATSATAAADKSKADDKAKDKDKK